MLSIKICGQCDDILIAALVVHLTFAQHKVRVEVGDCPVQNGFDKRTYTPVAALTDEN